MTDVRYFNPYIVYMHQGALPAETRLFERMCLWYELELITEGGEGAGIVTMDQFIPARPGTLFLRRPGDLVRGVAPFAFAAILFDVIYDPVLEPYYGIREASLVSDIDLAFLNKYFDNPRRSFAFIERIPRVMQIDDYEQLLRPMREIIDLEARADGDYQLHAKALLIGLLAQLARDADAGGRLYADCPAAIRQAQEYIDANYAQPLTLEALAEHVSLNREYFCRLFRQHAGKTPMRYLQDVRVYHAKLLLRSEEISVEEVANRCGFRDLSYFYSVFKKRTGQSPRQFRTRRPPGSIQGGMTAND